MVKELTTRIIYCLPRNDGNYSVSRRTRVYDRHSPRCHRLAEQQDIGLLSFWALYKPNSTTFSEIFDELETS
jgi:hypothetical protein